MIAVLTDPGVGGTFLTWSLHYLAGHKEYFLCQKNSVVELPGSPLTDINSHNFIPNQPTNIDRFNTILHKLINTQPSTFHTIYFHNFNFSIDSINLDLTNAISELANHTKKIVVLSNSKNSVLFNCSYYPRSHSPLWMDPNTKSPAADAKTRLEDFISYFFNDSKNKWDMLNLTNLWDQREFIALNFSFKKSVHIKPNIQSNIVCYNVDTMDLFNTFDTSVKDLFSYLEIEIDVSRWQSWKEIYNTWRGLHYNRLQFIWYFDAIIQSILNGEDFDLTRFKLDIIQEAAIQNYLIYNHNLNFKTWQLEKFTNTKQLNNLLEPNIHILAKT